MGYMQARWSGGGYDAGIAVTTRANARRQISSTSINEENGLSNRSPEQSRPRVDGPSGDSDLIVEAAQKAFNAHIAASRARAGKRRNRNAHIGRLPSELMATILLWSLRYHEKSSIKRLQELASVSVTWWKVVLASPYFWTTVDNWKPEHLKLKLRKCGALPLQIRVLHYDMKKRIKPHILSLLGLERLTSIVCSGRDMWDLAKVLGKPTPQLRVLDLGHRISAETIQVTIAPGEQLRHAHFQTVHLKNWTVLRNLTTLSIKRVKERDAPSPTKLLQVLRACPLLEDLALCHWTWATPYPDTKPDIREVPPLVMRQLRRLEIRGAMCRTTSILLSCLKAERLEMLKVEENAWVWSADRTFALAGCQELITTVALNTGVERTIITIRREDLITRCFTPDAKVVVDVTRIHCSTEAMMVVCSALPAELGQVTLRCRFPYQDDFTDDFAILQRLFCGPYTLVDVSLFCNHFTVSDVIRMLNQPISAIGNKAESWVAPKLIRLRVDHWGLENEEEIHEEAVELARLRETLDAVENLAVVDQYNRPVVYIPEDTE